MTVQRTRGEAKEEKGQNGGKNGTLATENTYLARRWSLFKPERGEGGEASWGSFWNGDGTHWRGKARRGSFNARIKGLGLGFGRGTLFSRVKGIWELKELGISAGRQQWQLTWWSVGGPTKSDEIFELFGVKTVSKRKGVKIGKFWVMKTEWWKLSDEKVLTKQGLNGGSTYT